MALNGFLGGLIALAAGGAMMVSPALAQDPPPSGTPEVWTYLNSLDSDERMEVMEREARREGRVVVYGALGIDFANDVLDPFREKYTDITVDFVRLREPELVERVNMEARAGRVGGDLAISNVPWLDLLKDDLGNYVPTTWDHYDERFLFGSEEEGWTAIVYLVIPAVIAWRTDRVDADEAPRKLEEVANERWKGRAGSTTHLESLIDGLELALGEDEAGDLVERLAAVESRLYPSMASLSDALSVGEVDLAWNIGAHRPVSLMAQGAPIDFEFPDPLLGLGLTLSVVDNGPNSYAAALLMEFISKASTLEIADKGAMQGGLLYGNLEGEYTLSIEDLPPLTLNRSIDEDRFSELSRRAEQLFLRR